MEMVRRVLRPMETRTNAWGSNPHQRLTEVKRIKKVDNIMYEEGDRVILTQKIGSSFPKGTEVEVTKVYTYNGRLDYINGKKIGTSGKPVGGAITVYPDQMEPLDCEAKLTLLKRQVETTKQYLKELKAEIEFLEKYEDEAAFTAHQINEIMKAGGNESAIAKILRDGRPTHRL